MDLEQEYVEYVMEFSLAILAVSAASLIDPSNPATFGAFLLVPVLYGYTAFISREKFKKHSALSLVALFFYPLGLFFAVVSILVSVGNILVSFFANGKSFKDYYGAVAVPMLLTSVLLGGAVYYMASNNAEVGEKITREVSGVAGNQTSTVIEEAEIIESQRQAQRQMVEQISTGSIQAARAYVINKTEKDLSPQDLQSINSAFRDAERDIPQRLLDEAGSREQPGALDIGTRVSDSIRNLLESNMIVLLPAATISFYGIHPLLGFLTAIFGYIFSKIDSNTRDSAT